MESPLATKSTEVTDIKMASLQKYTVLGLVSPDSAPSEHKGISAKWTFKAKVDHTLKGRVVVEGWAQVARIDSGCPCPPACHLKSIRMELTMVENKACEVLKLDIQTVVLTLRYRRRCMRKILQDTNHSTLQLDVPT